MSNPKLTVGVSFLNTRDTIEDLARSIFSQTFTDWEWILIDDGSSDGGAEVAQKIKDPRVTFICDGRNEGRSKRYNDITRMAKGEYIARFDADDLCDPTRFEKQIQFLEAHPEIDVVGTDRFALAPGDVLKGKRTHPTTHEGICRYPVRWGIFLCHGGVMGRTSWFEKFPYPENYRIAIDAALWASSWKHSRLANVPEPLYFYREYEAYKFTKFLRANWAMMRIAWEFGRRTKGTSDAIIAILARMARIGIFGALSLLHLHGYLVKRRSIDPTEEDQEQARRVLEIIGNTKVPGLDD